VSNTKRASALKRCPSVARVVNNSLAASIAAPRLWQAEGKVWPKPSSESSPIV
jgi:hypothetical protein